MFACSSLFCHAHAATQSNKTQGSSAGLAAAVATLSGSGGRAAELAMELGKALGSYSSAAPNATAGRRMSCRAVAALLFPQKPFMASWHLVLVLCLQLYYVLGIMCCRQVPWAGAGQCRICSHCSGPSAVNPFNSECYLDLL
jgi:hypothetical protein